MRVKNINVTESFIEELKGQASKIERNGRLSVKISDELWDFVAKELKVLDSALYQKIAYKFKYNRNRVCIGWEGGGEKTITRLIKEKKCSLELFHLIGRYLFQNNWTMEKQNAFKLVNLSTQQEAHVSPKKKESLEASSDLDALPKTSPKKTEHTIKVKGDHNISIVNGNNISIG